MGKGAIVAVFACVIVAAVAAGVYLNDQNNNTPVSDNGINDAVSDCYDLYAEPTSSDTMVAAEESEITSKGYLTYSTKGYEYVYTKHKATNTFDELTCLGTMDNVYYPGAVLVMSYDKDGNSVLKSTRIDRSPMTLSIGLETAKNLDTKYMTYRVENPNLSNVRTAVSTMINGAITEETSIPCVMSCEIVEYTSDNALAASLGIDVNIKRVNVDTGVDYTKETGLNRFALILKQVYFTVDMDFPSGGAADIFSKDTTADDIKSSIKDGEIPVYCSVVYGKIAIISIETTMSASELKANFNFSYARITDIDVAFSKTCKESNTSMSYFIYGGDDESSGIITTSTISDVVSALATVPTNSPKPIAYRFYTLDDNTIAHLSDYTEYIVRENRPIQIESLTLEAEDDITEVRPGDTVSFREIINPSDAVVYTEKNYDVSCSSKYAYYDSAQELLIVTDNAKSKIGDTITVTLTIKQVIGGKLYATSASCDLKIANIPVESIVLETEDKSNEIEVGVTTTIIAKISPDDASYGIESWLVLEGNANIVRGENQLSVTPISTGTLKIKAIEPDGNSATITLIVKETSATIYAVKLYDRGEYLEGKDICVEYGELIGDIVLELTRADENGYSYNHIGWALDGIPINTRSYPVVQDLRLDAIWETVDNYAGYHRLTQDSFSDIYSNLSGSYVLTEDITLPSTFTPIGGTDGNSSFTGTLNGNGKTIHFGTFNVPFNIGGKMYYGLFGKISGHAQIYNLTIDNAYLTFATGGDGTTIRCGVLVGRMADSSLVENVTVRNSGIEVNLDTSSSGMIVGYCDSGTISNCTAQSFRLFSNGDIGGICGCLHNGAELSGCFVTGSDSSRNEITLWSTNASRSCGGIVGYASNNSVIKNSGVSYADITFTGDEQGSNIGVILGHGSDMTLKALSANLDTITISNPHNLNTARYFKETNSSWGSKGYAGALEDCIIS